MTDATGNVTATYEYDVFGALRASTGAGATAFRYTGQQTDSATGLVYLRARYYDPTLGRFLSKDPFHGFATRPQSHHRYAYVENSPANAIDPSGLVRGWTLQDHAELGRLVHLYIARKYADKHPGSVPEYPYVDRTTGAAGRIDLLGPPRGPVREFWEIKPELQLRRGQRDVARRLAECGTAQFAAEHGFTVIAGTGFMPWTEFIPGVGTLRVWEQEAGLILYRFAVDPVAALFGAAVVLGTLRRFIENRVARPQPAPIPVWPSTGWPGFLPNWVLP
ncbi:MAG: RHS repeat-associated core domain-containing protein [Chloroflexota bacterium]